MKDLLLKLNREGIALEENEGKLKVHFLEEDISQDLLEEIKKNKDLLLALLKENKFESIPIIDQKDNYPLSHSQMRLWMLSQSKETSIAYNISSSFELGAIDIDHFKKSIISVVNRHESFRTIFQMDENGKVNQKIINASDFLFNIDFKDYKFLKDSSSEIRSFIKQDSQVPFDLEKGPLLRVSLIQISENKYVFYYCMHHIISDGWSMNILERDVMAYYESLQSKVVVVLPELKIQYKDYASWQIQQLELEEFNHHREYWLKKLSGDLPILDLPSNKNRPNLKTHNGCRLSAYISKSSTQALNTYCRENGGSLFMGLLAVWNVLCYRYTSQTDIIIGTPVAGRDHSDLKDQIGFYINTLALRNQINPTENFNDFFEKVKDNTITSFKHQRYPFDKLLEELDVKRDISRNAIFDVILALQNINSNTLDKNIANIINDVDVLEHGNCISKLDIELIFKEINGHLKLTLNYNSDVYDSFIMTRLIEHYKRILSSLLDTPEIPLCKLDYLSALEKNELLFELNNTKKYYLNDKTVVDLFREQVKKNPNKIAICLGNIDITYKELDERSNQVANYLISKFDINLEDIIGIKLDRSEWLLISMLAILKTGGAYVPIDPNYPDTRITYILNDTQAKVVIDEYFLKNFSKQDQFSKDFMSPKITPSNLSYIIYTSGSTGKPKGVMIEHKSLVNLCFWHKNAYKLNEFSKGTLFSGVGFDASVWEIYPYLLSGGTIYPIQGEDTRLDTNKLGAFFRNNKITHAYLPSKVCQNFIEQNIKVDTIILTGGEALQYSGKTDLKVYNNYGPTENTVVTSYYECKNIAEENIPIGKPIDNSYIYILSQNLELQPRGVIGEICIGGEGLSRGYLNLPELTKEKFIENPFIKSEKLYRTGDLGKFLDTGDLEFLGRIDDQVKIRGYRIELGEIEKAVLSTCLVSQTVIDVKELSGEKTIIAYVISNLPLDKKKLKEKLKESLPDYMVPSYYVELSSIPLTANGKVDKKSLPKINKYDLIKDEYIAPNTYVQKELVYIWQEILKVEEIGLKSNFFDLGGHSLKAVQVINEIHKKFEIRLEFGQMFSNPILEKQSLLIENSTKNNFIEIEKIEESDTYAISDAQRRLWILSQFDGASVSYNMPKSIILDNDYDLEIFKRSVAAVVDRHEILRTIFVTNDDQEVCQKILTREELRFEIGYKDFRREKDEIEVIRSYIEKDSCTPFDLSTGPLLRVSIIETSIEGYIFYYNMHHIISDGWSMNILERDVLAYYESIKKGSLVSLPSLPIQYKDYASWQLGKLSSASSVKHRDYWLNVLSGDLPLIDLPSSKTRPGIKTYNGHSLSTYIDISTTQSLKAYCRLKGGSLFIGLLATWNILCNRYSRQQDIIVGSPVAGRDHSSLEDQIGFYINTLVLRNTIDPEESFSLFYARVKENTLRSYEHQSYPFDRLVEELDIRRDFSRNAVFDVMLVLQNTREDRSKELIGDFENERTIEDKGNCNSKFDIELIFKEVGRCMSVSLKYNVDVYDRFMMEQLLVHFKTLLSNLLVSPNLPIKQVEYLSDFERLQLAAFNNTEIAYSQEKTSIDLFYEQVIKSPNDTAVIFGDIIITYKELDELSNQLSHYLITEHKIKSGDFVGVQLDRSEWMVISILAILKLGAGYVPIDPHYPLKRRKFIVSDSDCKTSIDEGILKDFKINQRIHSKGKVLHRVTSNDPSYVIYTSGSTGKPKGVLNIHEGLYNRLLWMKDDLKISPSDIFFQKTPFTFDVSVWELILPFITGSKLVIAKPNGHKDPKYLEDIIKQEGITITHFVPSMLAVFLEDLEINTCNSLKHIVCSGEALPSNLVVDFQQKLPRVRIHNLYGPTEAAIDVTSIDLTEREVNKVGVTIGKPVANTKIHIVDENFLLLPIGVPGELLIEGVQVAKGYVNRPELNEEKFVKKLFNRAVNVYRTGDLAKWLPNGEIIYIGRIDNQVKIRGNRIELGEIEEALLTIEYVNQAVGIVKKIEGIETIVAYVSVSKNLDKTVLREHLTDKLPDYMIPAYFVELELIPLNSNGKIDRKSLPEVTERDVIKNEYITPVSKEEKVLIRVFKEVLKHKKISIMDSFYNLGGDSIKALKIVSGLKQLRFVLKIEDLLRNPKIKDLAKVIIKTDRKINTLSYQKSNWNINDFIKLSDNQEIYLTKHSQGMFSSDINEFDSKSFDKKFRNFLSKFPTLCVALKKHENGRIEQQYISSRDVKLKINIHKIPLLNSKKKIDKLVKEYTSKPYDKLNGELIRVLVIKPMINLLNKEKTLVFVFINHILTDAYSNSLLKEQFDSFFNKNKIQENYYEPHFDYIDWQNQFLNSEDGKHYRKYWVDTLKDIKLLQKDKVTQVGEIEFTTQKIIVFGNKFKELQRIASKYKIPITILFLDLHQKLLRDYCANETLFQGVAVNGREQQIEGVDTNKIIGVINNLLPLPCARLDSKSKMDFFKILYSHYLKARKYQQVPFLMICKDIKEKYDRDLDDKLGGYFNFNIREDSVIETRPFKTKIEYINRVRYFGIDLTCLMYENAIDISLSCPLDLYTSYKDQLSIETIIDKLIQKS